jgi:hypothetical protein
MTPRREFLRQVGILLASLTATHCTPIQQQDHSAHARLRECWLSLDRLEEQAQKDYERGQERSERLQAEHRAALDDLVATGELDAAVAEQVQLIYDEAVYHIWRSLATCYEPVMIDYMPAARGQLIQQADLLTEMAAEGDLDPQVVVQAQAALERDIAFLNLSTGEREGLYKELIAAGPAYPRFDEVDLEIPSPAAQAANFLVRVLLQE